MKVRPATVWPAFCGFCGAKTMWVRVMHRFNEETGAEGGLYSWECPLYRHPHWLDLDHWHQPCGFPTADLTWFPGEAKAMTQEDAWAA